jgi:hypothetical protein
MYLKLRCLAGGLGAVMLVVPACALATQPEPWQHWSRATGVAPPAAGAEATAVKAVPGGAAPADGTLPELGAAVEPGQLEGTRGRNGGGAEAMLSGVTSGNSASQVATGNNVIQSGSFANTTGLPVVIQNSGANVLIQNATVINLQLK